MVYLRFRPTIFEKRTEADLYDVNVTIKQGRHWVYYYHRILKFLKWGNNRMEKTLSVENGNTNNSSKTNNNNIASSTLTTTSGNAANLVPEIN